MLSSVMRLWHLFGVILVLVGFEVILAKRCIRRRSDEIEKGRRCRRFCQSNENCTAPKKTCNCDGDCGMSCYNIDAVCDEPDNIPHGRVSRNGVKMQSVARYSCDRGYVIFGNRERTCSADKKWHPQPPRCKAGCSRPSRIANAYLPTFRESFRQDQTVTYRCKIGYYTYHSLTITCMDSGRWSQATFRCQSQICRAIPAVLNGRIIYSSQYYFGSIAILQCNRGFDPQHEGRRQICAAGRPGSSAGDWSGAPLGECRRKSCPPPLSPQNGQFEYVFPSSHKNEYETEIKYSCDIGFKLEGNSSNVCDDTGRWSELPNCLDIKCAQPPSSRPFTSRSWIVYSRGNLLLPDSRVHYRCQENHKVSGSDEVLYDISSTCEETETSSSWNPPLDSIKCEKILCDSPPLQPTHTLSSPSSKQSWGVGERVTVTCVEGYGFSYPRYSDTATCTNKELWDPGFTSCQDIRCPEARRLIPNGKRVGISNKDVTYSCNENHQFPGRTLVKTRTIKCDRYYYFKRSRWATDLNRLSCQRIPCRKVPMGWNMSAYRKQRRWDWWRYRSSDSRQYEYISSRNWYAGDEAFFKCSDGYKFDYTKSTYFLARCLGTGQWEDSLRPCIEDIECREPPSTITKGQRLYLSQGLLLPGALAGYKCNDGYAILREATYFARMDVTCTKNVGRLGSAWNPMIFQSGCQEIRCNRPLHGEFHVLEDHGESSWGIGERVRARCRDGYDFSLKKFVDTLSCTDSGNWDSIFTACQDIRCPDARYWFPNGRRVSISNKHAVYSCNRNHQFPGGTLVKTRMVKCERGYNFERSGWGTDLNSLRCERIPCPKLPIEWHLLAYRKKLPERRGQHSSANFLQLSTDWYAGEEAIFKCSQGYKFDHAEGTYFPALCLETGQWADSLRPCIEDIECLEPPSAIMNGYRLDLPHGPLLPGAVVGYKCNEGYAILHGATYFTGMNITCTKNDGSLGSAWNPMIFQSRCQADDENGKDQRTHSQGMNYEDEGSGGSSSVEVANAPQVFPVTSEAPVDSPSTISTAPMAPGSTQFTSSFQAEESHGCATPEIDMASQRISDELDYWKVGSIVTVTCLENFRYENYSSRKNYTCRGNKKWKPRKIEPCLNMGSRNSKVRTPRG